jgi:hypothetical protein
VDVSNRDWLMLAVACGAAVVGLLLASDSPVGGTRYALGLGLFVLAVVYAFASVKRHFDRIDQARH